jgi:hypothetical protein
MSNDVRIDRLKLAVPGVSRMGLRRIATRVAEGLSAAGGLPQAVEIPHLRVVIEAGAASDEASLARLIVEAALRDLARTQ